MGVRQYIGARYVPKFFENNGSSAWVSGFEYEALTIVTRNGNSYTSKKPVPANIGAPELNPEYWVATGLFNQQVETIREDVVDLQTGLADTNERIDDLVEESSRILVVGTGAQFSTINEAITEARTFCTPTQRALIFVLPGDYNEQIILRPNPGIDIVGYGARIKGQYSYPNCCLYTNGKGTFVGLYFENNYENAYAVHIERDTDDTAGAMKFYDCDFVSMQYHGLGCGMTGGSELHLRGCRFYSYSNVENSAALYLHNSQDSNQSTQTIYVVNCWFESRTFDVRIDDACNIHGGTNSPLRCYFFNTAGSSYKVRFFNASYSVANASHYQPGPNVTLRGGGNADIALNQDRIESQEIYCPAHSNGYISFPLAYSTKCCEPLVTLPDNSGIALVPGQRDGSYGAGPNLSGVVRVQIRYIPL